MSEAFRFLHGSDFRLDLPMRNLAQIPQHLRSTIADAAYTAGTRFFDLAITESVDFVLLSGNLLDSDLGACRPAAWLLNQFERLREKGIRVYWCAGQTDQPDRWPSGVELPDNVVTFAATIIEESVFERRGKPLATIVGGGYDSRRNSTSDFVVDSTSPFPIVLTCGGIDAATPLARNVRYWAVGGGQQPLHTDRGTAFLARIGTHQARSINETGPHGCLIVRVDSAGTMKTHFHELDTVRWMPQQLSIAESASQEEMQNLLGERALRLVTTYPDRLLLVPWHITAAGPFQPGFRAEKNIEQLLKWLRDEFGRSTEGIWSTTLQIAPPEAMPQGWYEEDTLLGDYLRAVGRYQGDESLSLAWHDYLPESTDEAVAATLVRATGDARSAILGDAAVLGAGYLAEGRSGAEAMSGSQT